MKHWKLGAFVVVAMLTVAVVFNLSYDLGSERLTVDFSDRVSETDLRGNQFSTAGGDIIRFGFDLRASAQEDARQYLPFLKYLRQKTGYSFELRFTPKDDRIAEDLGAGVVHLAAVGAVSFIKAREEFGVMPLVRGLNHEGKGEYQSVIVVAPDSGVKKLADLRGKRFAFGSIDSTQGHLIPRLELQGAGIGLDGLAAYEYTGSHQNCANAVISGRFDACGMQDTMARRLVGEGKLRILHTSAFFPSSGIAASKTLAPEALQKIRKALIDFKPKGRDKAGLHNWDRTEMPNGFTPAEAGDYARLRQALIDFGMM